MSMALPEDSNCLLQSQKLKLSSLASSHDVSLIQQASGHGAQPTALFEFFASMAREGHSIGPEEHTMIEGVVAMLEQVSLPALLSAHEADLARIARVDSELVQCDDLRNALENVAVANPNGGPPLAHAGADISAAREAHGMCRAEELELHTTMSDACAALAAWVATLEEPESAPQPQEPSDEFASYLRTNHQWFDEHYDTYMEYAGRCTSATTGYEAKPAECNDAQGAFETAFCIDSTNQGSACAAYNACFVTSEREAADSRAEVTNMAEQRKAEHVTLKKVQCIITILMREEGDEAPGDMGDCRVHSQGIAYDGSEFDPSYLNVSFPELPLAAGCEEVGLSPCDEAWIAMEYGSMPAPLAPAACTNCADAMQAMQALAPPRADTGCQTCVEGFAAAGGCDSIASGADPTPLVPEGCAQCGQQLGAFCQSQVQAAPVEAAPVKAAPVQAAPVQADTSCEDCVQAFADAGGCGAIIGGQDPTPLVPAGCSIERCGQEMGQFCHGQPAPAPAPTVPETHPVQEEEVSSSESSEKEAEPLVVYVPVPVPVPVPAPAPSSLFSFFAH